MYKKISTEGLILSKRGVGEGDTAVLVLTKDLGLLRAAARSARREHSKLRYGLEPLTHARFSFVQGKRGWRLIGVDRPDLSLLKTSNARRGALGRIVRLLLRLIHGEEQNVHLYKNVTEGFALLIDAMSDADAAGIECVLVLRILSSLGYLSHTSEITHFLESDLHSLELAMQAAQHRATLVRLINDSLQASGL
jgi:DNA repair protein RecO